MTTLYHPDLPEGQNIVEVPDDEGTIAVHRKSGWTTTPPKKHQGAAPASSAAAAAGTSEQEGKR